MAEAPQHPNTSSVADATPLPIPVRDGEPSSARRARDAWCEWLGALATDAEAALSAAIAYRELDDGGRDEWLSALEQDAAHVDVPRVAVYAPLLAVESDAARRTRILAAIGDVDDRARPRVPGRSLHGTAADGLRVAVIVRPLYLQFAQVLACGYRTPHGFAWVRHDPIVHAETAPRGGDSLESVRLEVTPLKPLVDELALAVVAHSRAGRELPDALRIFADLFGPGVSSSSIPPPPRG